jgi:4-hydroxy-2-oxoheptanedioate aldolase
VRASACSTRLISVSWLDFVCVDLQHGVIDDDAVLPMLQARATSTNLDPCPDDSPEAICRALDRGAGDRPLVDSPAEAAAAASPLHHPPRGTRSYGPVRAPGTRSRCAS